MKTETWEFYNECVSKIVEEVVRSGPGPIRVPEIAEQAGFSRFHLSRFFYQCMGESLSDFVRRIQLERAAYLLHHTEMPIGELSWLSGYRMPEAFCRAFRSSFGLAPSEFRKLPSANWKLPNPQRISWNPDMCGLGLKSVRSHIETELIPLTRTRVAVWRVVGFYTELGKAWAELENLIGGPWCEPGTRFFTIYRDNLWTYPDESQLRADIGFSIGKNTPVPLGMTSMTIPGGLYAASTQCYTRHERQSAWSAMCGIRCEGAVSPLDFDEHPSWPNPWDKALTRMFVGLGPAHSRFADHVPTP